MAHALVIYNHSDNDITAIFVTEEIPCNEPLLKALKASKHWEPLVKDIKESGVLDTSTFNPIEKDINNFTLRRVKKDINDFTLQGLIEIIQYLNEQDVITDSLTLQETE